MAEQRNLIDQALSIIEESGPPRLGKSIPLDPQQALVWSIYTATRDREAGHGSEAEVKNFVKIARSSGIAEHEIGAAFVAASSEKN